MAIVDLRVGDPMTYLEVEGQDAVEVGGQSAESRIMQVAIDVQESRPQSNTNIIERAVVRLDSLLVNNAEKIILSLSMLGIVISLMLIVFAFTVPASLLFVKIGLIAFSFAAISTIVALNVYAFKLHIPSAKSNLQKALGPELKNNVEVDKWLKRIFLSKDYQADPKTETEKYRVFIELANKDENYRKNIFLPLIEQANRSCGDRIGVYKIFLEVQTNLYQFDIDDHKSIAEYIIHTAWGVDTLVTCAKEKVNEIKQLNNSVDEIEVYLYYFLQLKHSLGLKIDVQKMMFGSLAKKFVTDENILTAKEFVIEKRKNQEESLRYLCNHEKWNEVLKHNFPEEMKDLDSVYEKYESIDEAIEIIQETQVDLTRRLLLNFAEV